VVNDVGGTRDGEGASAEPANVVVAEIEAAGGTAVASFANVATAEGAQKIVKDAVSAFGKVDVLVNNAATNPYFGPFLDIDDGAWDKTFEVNVKGYFWMTREVVKHLRSREAPGAIVNVASVAGLMASPAQGVYAMTKAAILSMTKTMAVELVGNKIRVNAIAPGFVDTKFASAILKNDVLLDEVLKMTPMRRYGQPDEIAGGALYLASDSAGFLTGHTLVIDGGMTVS
jgi:NAD(P)-dependent dehydrogenase (short-subunit alcohol dehydrogenase family)